MARLALAAQPPDQRWDRLVQGMAGGDRDALASFYDATCGPVLALVGRIVKDDATAEEVTGDVYVQAWQQADRFAAPGRRDGRRLRRPRDRAFARDALAGR